VDLLWCLWTSQSLASQASSFLDPGMKINGGYYRDVHLSQQLLPVMCDVSGDFCIFQQDVTLAHWERT